MAGAEHGQFLIADWAVNAAILDADAHGQSVGAAFLATATGGRAGSSDAPFPAAELWALDPNVDVFEIAHAEPPAALDEASRAWLVARHHLRLFPALDPEALASTVEHRRAVMTVAHHSYRVQLASTLRRADAYLDYVKQRPWRVARRLERAGVLPARDQELRALGINVPADPHAVRPVIDAAHQRLQARLEQPTLLGGDFVARVLRDADTLNQFNAVAGMLSLYTLRLAQQAVTDIAESQRFAENAITLHTAIAKNNVTRERLMDQSTQLVEQMIRAAVPGHRLADDLGVRALIGERPGVDDPVSQADGWDRSARLLMAMVQGGVLDNLHHELDPNWPDFTLIVNAVEFARGLVGRMLPTDDRPRTELSQQLDGIRARRAERPAQRLWSLGDR
ncbi:MAG: hypothetical protein ACOYNI_02315 [Acidimicrobiia bacterium]